MVLQLPTVPIVGYGVAVYVAPSWECEKTRFTQPLIKIVHETTVFCTPDKLEGVKSCMEVDALITGSARRLMPVPMVRWSLDASEWSNRAGFELTAGNCNRRESWCGVVES